MGTSHGGLPRRTVGLFVEPLCRHLSLAVLDLQGPCLAGRLAHVGGRTVPLPDDLQRALTATLEDSACAPSQLADVSARLAEFQAETLHGVLHTAAAAAGADVEPLLVATSDPYVRHAVGRPWQSALSLGNPARLAELTGYNVLDACEARNMAAGTDVAAIDNLALWLLLHSAKRDRVYLEYGGRLRVVVLPAGCEPSAAARVSVRTMEAQPTSDSPVGSSKDLAWRVVEVLGRLVPQSPNPIQLLPRASAGDIGPLVEEILRIAPFTEVLDWRHVHVWTDWLDAAVTAAMGHLLLDHIPQASVAMDLERAPRLLGRLTPGSIVNWHRLLAHLAARLPEIVPLRAAI